MVMKTEDVVDPPSCVVQGRVFVQRGAQWVDTAVDELPDARHVRVRFDSREFIDLAVRYPQTLPYLSTVTHVQLALDDTVYEIYR